MSQPTLCTGCGATVTIFNGMLRDSLGNGYCKNGIFHAVEKPVELPPVAIKPEAPQEPMAFDDLLTALKAILGDLWKHAHGQSAPGHTEHIKAGWAAIRKAEEARKKGKPMEVKG